MSGVAAVSIKRAIFREAEVFSLRTPRPRFSE